MYAQPKILPRFLTVADCADRLSVSTRSIVRWIDAGELRAHRLGSQVRF